MPPMSFPLWDGTAPGALGADAKDIPTITAYPAAPGSGMPHPAMVIFPGGGYRHLASHEGAGYAEWLAGHGFASFVVRYRLSADSYRWPVMLWDAARAVRWVRAHADEYGVDPTKIGLIGSSAGGHLAASLTAQAGEGDPQAADPVERHSARPDLCVLCYSVLVPDLLVPAGELQSLLLGPQASAEKVKEISPLQWVSERYPPCFLMHTIEDTRVLAAGSLRFAEALREQGVPFELHLYEKGRHGIGLASGHPWTAECIRWLREKFV